MFKKEIHIMKKLRKSVTLVLSEQDAEIVKLIDDDFDNDRIIKKMSDFSKLKTRNGAAKILNDVRFGTERAVVTVRVKYTNVATGPVAYDAEVLFDGMESEYLLLLMTGMNYIDAWSIASGIERHVIIRPSYKKYYQRLKDLLDRSVGVKLKNPKLYQVKTFTQEEAA